MSIIKYNNKTINKLEYNTSEVNKMYYNSDVCYGGDGGSPEPPTPPTPVFNGKWLATYQDSHTESAECDASSAITNNEVTRADLVAVEIGDCVTSIGNSAFANCTSLTSATIGNGVTSIEVYAFMECSSLTNVTIGSGVTSIGNYVFKECTSLTSVTIPDSVTTIGIWAFGNCSSLTNITIEATTPPKLSKANTFNNTNNCPIMVPAQSVSAYKSANIWSQYASRIKPIP